ncbi:MAG: hypothetical protein H0U04_15070 [Rubrobacter sp.]|nr:hypothetical protein [Rubrobacter sp.]
MDYMEKSGRVTERVARTTGDSYKTVLDFAVSIGERNVRFAQGVTDSYIKELRHQAEANRALTHELVERAEGQRGAFQAVVNETLDAYMDFLYTPLSYYKEGLRLVEREATGGGLPIANYDELNVDEVSKRLDGLSAAEIRELRIYEKQNKSRETLIDQFDRKLKAASA